MSRADGAGQGEGARRLVDEQQGQVAAGGGGRAGERLGPGTADRKSGRLDSITQGLAYVVLGVEGAGAVEAACAEGGGSADGENRAGGNAGGGQAAVGPEVDVVEGVAAGDVAAGEDDLLVSRFRSAGRVRLLSFPTRRSSDLEGARRLVDEQQGQVAAGGGGRAGERLGPGT